MDCFFANGRPFFTHSKKIDFHTVQAFTGGGKAELGRGANVTKKMHESRGYEITACKGGNEFEKIGDHVLLAELVACAANEHVGNIEKPVHAIKEWA